MVYGGGGIMPDVFIPLDTTSSSRFYTDLCRKSVFNDFVLGYLEQNRNRISRDYKSFESFKSGFNIDEPIIEQFLSFAAGKGVTPEDDSMEKSGKEIKHIIKGIIARNLFDTNSYFDIISPIDNELMHAKQVMDEGSLFQKLSIAH